MKTNLNPAPKKSWYGINHLEEKLEKKVRRRERRKKPKMKVSGKSVFKLKELMKRKKSRVILLTNYPSYATFSVCGLLFRY